MIAVVCPWNLPLLLMTWKVGPAMACGNTFVVKPSEEAPSTATLLAEVMNKVGIPKGVYNVVHGFGPNSAGAFLTDHPDVNGITFSGETRTGTAIVKAGAEGIRPVSLELGGKNAALVFADCEFDLAVNTVTRSVIENAGKVCLGTERVYVERLIFDKFVTALKGKAEGMTPGRPDDPATKIGPLVSKEHQDKVLSYYQKAKDKGATIVSEGGIPDMPEDLKDGCWVQPTIWTGLPETASVVQEEIFGPCCHIQPFDTEAEAIAMANDTKYGWPPRSTPRTSTGPAASPPKSKSGCVGSTAGSSATCEPPSAAPNPPASTAKAVSTPWSSTPNCATSWSSSNHRRNKPVSDSEPFPTVIAAQPGPSTAFANPLAHAPTKGGHDPS